MWSIVAFTKSTPSMALLMSGIQRQTICQGALAPPPPHLHKLDRQCPLNGQRPKKYVIILIAILM